MGIQFGTQERAVEAVNACSANFLSEFSALLILKKLADIHS